MNLDRRTFLRCSAAALGAAPLDVQMLVVGQGLRLTILGLALGLVGALALTRLMALRSNYRPSFGFVVGCLPVIARLHLRTALENRFPREARAGADPRREPQQ